MEGKIQQLSNATTEAYIRQLRHRYSF